MPHWAINDQPARRDTTDLAVIRPEPATRGARHRASVLDAAKFALTSVTERTRGFVSMLDHG